MNIVENKTYKIEWIPKALKELYKLKDQKIINEIKKSISNKLSKNPWGLGKRLEGNWIGHWDYRVRDYRVIYKIHENKLTIEVVEVDNRKDIFKIR